MFENLKLRDRTLFGYAIPTTLILLFSGTVYATANKIAGTFRQVNISQNAIIGADIAILSLGDIDRKIRGYLLLKDANSYRNYQAEKERFQKAVERIGSVIEDEGQKEKLKTMIRMSEEFDELVNITLRLEDGGKHNEAIASYLREVQIIMDNFDQLKEEFNNREQEIMGKNIESTESNIDFLIFLAILASVFSLIVAVWAVYLIINFLGARLNKVVKAADQISTGDLSQVIEVPSNNKDELWMLLDAFQTMRQNLNSLVRQVQHSGIQVTTSATQIAASGKQLEATVTEQLASTNEVVSTAKEIAATSRDLVRTMDEVTAMSESTASAAGDGQKDLVRMETTMRQLADATSSISSKLGVISEKANNIGGVILTITKVADQTNLLSLNAAIEAEKAGEYGVGFSVVAREIRRLADQTAVATLDIEQMIKAMQSAVSTGVMEMDKFTQEVGRGVEDVRNVSVQLAQIIEQVQALSPQFQVVNQGMETQSQSAQQISEAMLQLNEASAQTAESLRQTNTALEQLNSAAQSLQREVSRFKVKE